MIGTKTELVEQFWRRCCREHGIDSDDYFASTFADHKMATYHDTLLDLVGQGKKRATAHLELDFPRSNVNRRTPGDYWVVLDSVNLPRFLLRITDVESWPFDKVPVTFAAREGEGDCSLQYWREVHRDYFQQQCASWSVEWSESLETVCEGFELVSSPDEN